MKRLDPAFVLLAFAFYAVSEDLMKEHACRSAAQDRWAAVRFGFGRMQKRREIAGGGVDRL